MAANCSTFLVLRFFIVVSAAVALVSVGSARADDDCDPVAKAAALTALSGAEAWAKKLTTFHAQFTQDSSAVALGASEQSGGTVVYSNPGKMRWTYEWPEKQDFVIDGDTMTLYQPLMNQMLIDSAKAILSSELPVAFLTGIATVTEKFSLVRGCKLETPGREGEKLRLELTPKAKSAITALHLVVDGGGAMAAERAENRVTAATVIDESDNMTSFTFSRIIEGGPLKRDQFKIEVPTGTDVQDNRKK